MIYLKIIENDEFFSNPRFVLPEANITVNYYVYHINNKIHHTKKFARTR